MAEASASSTGCSGGGTVLVAGAVGVVVEVVGVLFVDDAVVGFVLGDGGMAVATAPPPPHEEEEDEGGEEEDSAGDAHAQADFEARVGGGGGRAVVG